MKIPFWATVLTLMGLMILFSLGSWQLKRLVWKQGILASIAAQHDVEARNVPLKPSSLLADDYMRRGFITGVYDHSKEFLIYNRTLDGVPGYHLFTSLTLTQQHAEQGVDAILVNRGFIPVEAEREAGVDMFKPSGIVQVSGVLRHTFDENMFVPQNHPEKEIWYRIDPAQMASAKEIGGLSPHLFYAEQEYTQEAAPQEFYPITIDGKITPNNNHAQYAFFWFAMAAAMIGVYVVRFILPQINGKNA